MARTLGSMLNLRRVVLSERVTCLGRMPDEHRAQPRRGVPAGFRLYRKLQPGPWFSSVGSEEFIERYNAEVLAPLGPAQVHELMALAGGGKIPAWSAESTSVAFAPAVVSSCLAAAWMAEAIDSRCSGTSTCRKRAPAPLIAHRRARARDRPLTCPA